MMRVTSSETAVPNYGGTSTTPPGSSTQLTTSRNAMDDDLGYDCSGGGLNDEIVKDCCPRFHSSNTYQRLHNMEIKHRLIILLVLVALLIVIFAIVTRLSLYGHVTLLTSPGEMRPIRGVDDAYSDQMCSSLHVKTVKGSLFEAFLFSSIPDIGSHEEYTATKMGTMNSMEYAVWRFYLIQTSEVEVLTCANDSKVEFWVIRGKANWNKWVTSAKCSSCYVHHETYQPCKTKPAKYTLKIGRGDEYYFAYVNKESKTKLPLHVIFNLNRALYDTSTAHTIIEDTRSTEIPISFGDKPVIYISRDGVENDEAIFLECRPNILMYFVYFCFVPIGCIAVLTAFGWCLIKLQRSIIRDVNNADRARRYRTLGTMPGRDSQPSQSTTRHESRPSESWSTLSQSSSTELQRGNDAPPDYESVTFSEPPPPSYDEATQGQART